MFDDEPPRPQRPAVRPSYGAQQEQPRNKPRINGGATAAVVVAAAVVAGVVYTSHQHSAKTTAGGPPESYIIQPAPARKAGACVDSSGSAGDGGSLARTTLRTTNDVLRSWTTGLKISTSGEVKPQRGLTLVVRVVEANSFGTRQADAHTAMATIPGVSGLTQAEPVSSEDSYVEKIDQYDADHKRAASELSAARKARASAIADVGKLIPQVSSGSDVTGCVLALADILGANSDILVVSDLQDTKFTAANPDQLAGRMNGIRLWIAQA